MKGGQSRAVGASHYVVSMFFRAQKISKLLYLCGLEFFEKHVRLCYANLRVSADSGNGRLLCWVITLF